MTQVCRTARGYCETPQKKTREEKATDAEAVEGFTEVLTIK